MENNQINFEIGNKKITYLLAKLAFDKGFRYYCDERFNDKEEIEFSPRLKYNSLGKNIINKNIIYAPSCDVLKEWLLSKHKIFVNVKLYTSGVYSYEVMQFNLKLCIWEKKSAFMERGSYNYYSAYKEGLFDGLKLIDEKN